MRDTADSSQSTRKRRRFGFGLRGLRLHHLLFLAFTLVAAGPIAVLAIWESNVAFRNEVDSVRERHLLVARNLTSTMSRYVQDVKAVFSMAFDSGALARPIPGMSDLLLSLNVVHLCVIGPDGTVQAKMDGLPNDMGVRLEPKIIDLLRSLAARSNGEPILSNLVKNRQGQPVMLLAKPLSDGRIGLGVLAMNYLLTLQQSIAFGDNGHAVITDAAGQVIAHPFKDWTAASRDLSGVPVVAAMKRGETGVGQFYSPAFKGDMIAGYSVVPETGWGVMVPQPMSELKRRASQVNEMATAIAIVSFAAAAFLAWLIAVYLARPVRAVADTAESVLRGNDQVSAPVFRGWVPHEIRRLGEAFNTMLEGLRLKAAETRHALQQAEASSQAKTQFLANMSHEIRTPLNGVVGMIELMRLTELSPTQRRYTDQATQSSQALLRLIDDILDLSRIEVGRLELEAVPFHLPSLVHDARMLFAEPARDKGLRLSVSVPDDLNVMLVGDPHRLLQVLTNLLGNAIKFTAEGGVIIRATREEDDDSSITVRFEIVDTGIGIPASQRERIFEAFTQGDSSMTRRFGGTGLGLSISRELVRMMGGQIGVSSSVGAGSTFWFTVRMPRSTPQSVIRVTAKAPMDDRETSATGAARDAGGDGFVPAARQEFQEALRRTGRSAVRLMLVEDNAANMRVTRALLETLGCEVIPAENGLEAVERYRTETFDLVLMDCQMPEMDGYEATRAIRQIEAVQGRTTPIIALTAHAMAGSREACLDAGMNDQFTKPLTMAVLIRLLLKWLPAVDARAEEAVPGGN